MSFLTKMALSLGLTVMLGVPLGALYVSLSGDGVELLTIAVATVGFLVGVVLVGISQTARTWSPY